MQETIFFVTDVETTGLDPNEDRIVEIATVATTADRVLGMWATLVNPERLIPPEVTAIHMLTDADVAHAPKWRQVESDFLEYRCRLPDTEESVIVAHNAAFDKGFITHDNLSPGDDTPWLCTQRLARHTWADAPAYKNQVLRYWRKLKVDTFGILPHRALADALVTAALLRDILASEEFARFEITTPSALVALANSPIVLKAWPKGKYYGQPFEAARGDKRYIDWWLYDATGVDPDLRYTLEFYRKQGLF